MIPTGTFIDYGETYLYSVLGNSVETRGGGQFYRQMQEKLFIVLDTSITMYNLNENTYESIATLPESVDYKGCLAANNDITYVVGGRDIVSFQIQLCKCDLVPLIPHLSLVVSLWIQSVLYAILIILGFCRFRRIYRRILPNLSNRSTETM